MLTEKLQRFFDRTINLVYAVILVAMVIGIGIGAIQLANDLWVLLRLEGITGKYIDLIADVLTLYVLVELSRSLLEYFDSKKLRMTYIVDAALIFIIREVLIGLFKHELKPEMVYALSALILVMGVLRIGSALVYIKGRQARQP
ncbi:phosphate-starvation-inducible PsiE family protein [Marinobacterium arenosum]|uniref:phosphate-starvation-inducible PsiE family protein n=1 Tax=Marinobacterium arenosum TaxID=2862496 RepID=UPI001C96C4B7|nr:phosphate-starvation-inducible PsiE family protein [Marinobacterium arenosum]MBY4677485.1 phosphate-starvation-inducible PsiE family protein [Marinobacterium arenosum]